MVFYLSKFFDLFFDLQLESNEKFLSHESPRRGETFVTRKITRSVAKISLNELDCMELGKFLIKNINSFSNYSITKIR